MKSYQWVVSTTGTDGHAKEHLAGGFEDDKDQAIARVKEQVDRLREQQRRGWYAAVMDMHRPVLSHTPPPPMVGWEYVYFDEG